MTANFRQDNNGQVKAYNGRTLFVYQTLQHERLRK